MNKVFIVYDNGSVVMPNAEVLQWGTLRSIVQFGEDILLIDNAYIENSDSTGVII